MDWLQIRRPPRVKVLSKEARPRPLTSIVLGIITILSSSSNSNVKLHRLAKGTDSLQGLIISRGLAWTLKRCSRYVIDLLLSKILFSDNFNTFYYWILMVLFYSSNLDQETSRDLLATSRSWTVPFLLVRNWIHKNTEKTKNRKSTLERCFTWRIMYLNYYSFTTYHEAFQISQKNKTRIAFSPQFSSIEKHSTIFTSKKSSTKNPAIFVYLK